MTLENKRLRTDALESRAYNRTSSNEDVQLLIDGAEVVLAGRQAKALREGSDRYPSIDPRTLGQGETDLYNDVETATYGEDQSDFQNKTSTDKDFGSSARNDNIISYFDPESGQPKQVTLADGVPTRNAPGVTWQERRAIREAALMKGYGGEGRRKPSARDGGTDESGRKRTIYSSTEEPTTRDTGGGKLGARSAFSALEAKVLAGEIGLDDPVPSATSTSSGNTVNRLGQTTPKQPMTVRQLMARLQAQDPQRSAQQDRRQGARAAQAEKRIAAGDPDAAQREVMAQRLVRTQADEPVIPYSTKVNKVPGETVNRSRPTENILTVAPGPTEWGSMADVTVRRARSNDPSLRASEPTIGIEEARALVDAQYGDGIFRAREARGRNNVAANDRFVADAANLRRQRRILDSLPELEPGGKAYVRNENSDDARALMIEAEGAPISVSTEDAYMLDGIQGSSNAQGMQRVKLQDYAIKDPNSPANWSASQVPAIAAEGYSPARVYYDGSGNIVGGEDPVGYTAPGQVADVSGKGALNVPTNPVTVQDLAAQEITKRQSAERMRQVDISGTLGGLVDRVNASTAGRSGALGEVAQPRSLADLQGLVDKVADAERAGGRKMYAFDPASPGRSRPTTEPTARDILANTLKLSPDEVGNVAQALTMLDAARDTSVPVDASPMARSNHQFKEDYYAGLNDGATPGARPGANTVAGVIRTIPDTKPVYGVDPTADPNVLGRNALHHIGSMGSKDRVVVGVDKNGNPVKMEVGPQLRGLTGEGLNDLSSTEKDLVLKMARSNQQGTFSGDASVPRVYQGPIDRRSREDVILGAMNKYEGFGKPNDTAGIIKSANRDLQNEAALGATDKAISSRQSALDSAPTGVRNTEDAIFSEAAKRKAGAYGGVPPKRTRQGRQFDAPDSFVETAPGSGQMYRVPGAKRGELLQAPSNITPTQPIQESRVATSIAPDPWAGTGPARMEVASQPAAQRPQLALPPGRSGRQLTPELRSELFALDGPSQGPAPSTRNYMGAPDGAGPTPPSRREQLISSIRDGVDNVDQKARAFATSPRFERGRKRAAVGAAGLGALAAGLGLSNIGREEEEEVRY